MRKHPFAAILAGLTLTLVIPVAASGQATLQKSGWLAKVNVAKATTEAKKWRSDSHLFQITATNVQDGVARWTYSFFSPGATGQKCHHVMFGLKGEVGGTDGRCAFDTESKLADFTVDSDKAFDAARKAGLAKPSIRGTLRMFPVRGMGDRPVWLFSEGAKTGDKSIEVDAITGEIRSRVTIP